MHTFYLAALLLCATCAFGDDDEVTRKLHAVWNPGCSEQSPPDVCAAHRLLYINASAPSDTLHVYMALWDTPACLLLRTPGGVTPQINWTELVSDNPEGALMADSVLASYGFSMDQLLEFDDPKDTADWDKAANRTVYSMTDLDFTKGTLTSSNSSSEVRLSLQSPPLNFSGLGSAGTVTIQLLMLNSARRTDQLPHLLQTGDSVVVDVLLRGLETSSGFGHPRFGVRLTTAGNEPEKLNLTKSLDDEYTPGVFKLYSLGSSEAAGFVQWRPVAYTAAESTIEHSTSVRQYNLTSDDEPPASPLLRAFFTDGPLRHTLPVTFGIAEDGWYSDAKFAQWSVTVGLGAAPKDQFSLMVILLLGIGLGLPTLALLGGGVWMGVRRLRGRAAGPTHLIDNEGEE